MINTGLLELSTGSSATDCLPCLLFLVPSLEPSWIPWLRHVLMPSAEATQLRSALAIFITASPAISNIIYSQNNNCELPPGSVLIHSGLSGRV